MKIRLSATAGFAGTMTDVRTATTICLASIAFLFAGPASGQSSDSCDDPKTITMGNTDSNRFKVRTIFVLETTSDKVFEVEVYRNEQEKNDKYLNKNNTQMKTTMNVKGYNKPKFDVISKISRRDNPGTEHIQCRYIIDATNDPKETWKPPASDDVCGEHNGPLRRL